MFASERTPPPDGWIRGAALSDAAEGGNPTTRLSTVARTCSYWKIVVPRSAAPAMRGEPASSRRVFGTSRPCWSAPRTATKTCDARSVEKGTTRWRFRRGAAHRHREIRSGRAGCVACRSVGSKGGKPRKPSHSQHLAKVGTKTENERLLHDERRAIGDTLGLGAVPAWARIAMVVIIAVLFVVALLAFIRW
jgi:hypothetical protein